MKNNGKKQKRIFKKCRKTNRITKFVTGKERLWKTTEQIVVVDIAINKR